MPLLWLSIAFILGIIIASIVAMPTATWLILAGITLILSFLRLWLKRFNVELFAKLMAGRLNALKLLPPLPLLLLFLFLGAARYQFAIPDLADPNFIATYNDSDVSWEITGLLISPPDVRDTYINLRLEVESINPYRTDADPRPVTGLLLARVDHGTEFHYGDRITLRGSLETPPENEDFSYRDYLARQGVYSLVRGYNPVVLESRQGNPFFQIIYDLKTRALNLIYRLWPDPEASLFAGILLGVETGIPAPVQQAFKDTGTSHVIAISGFNITIIAALFANFFGRFLGPRRGALAAVLGIGIYTLLVGADPAVVRSAIMGGLALFAQQIGRRQNGINALGVTAAVMAIINPHVPWDVGFQLSFAATLGLVLYADPMSEAFIHLAARKLPQETAKKLAGPVGEYFLFTIAAQITTLPIMAYHFGRISLIAFITNPVILPVQPPIMTVGGLALILALIWFPLGKIVAMAAWPFVLFTIRAVEFFAQFSGGVINLGDLGLLWVILFYGGLFGLTFGWSRARKWIPALKPIPLIAALGVITVVVWRAALIAPDGRLHLTLLDVGTGDAILLQTPAGRYILIDGGPSTSLLSDGLGRRLPPFGRELDWLVVAAPRWEQIAALPRAIDRFPPTNVLWAGVESPSREADYLRESLTSHNIPLTLAQPGHALDLGEGASLQVLTAGQRGAILLLEWENFRALLPLGASMNDFESLGMGKEIGNVTVLLLADNGYAPLNPPQWINTLRPQLVLLSVAADDRDGRPDREVLDALGGYSLLRTDQNGWIQIATDGQQMWVEVEK